MSRGPRKPTIIEGAAAAGVARTTASDALNGRGRVNAATRERVNRAATRLGYRANINARTLRSGQPHIIALMLPPMEAIGEHSQALGIDFNRQLTSGITASAFAHGYAVVLIPPLDRPEQMLDTPFDGAIVNDPLARDERVALLDSRDIPVVTIERDFARPADPWYVATSGEQNARVALDHLAARGAKRIALIAPDATWAWAVDTTEAYQRWCSARRRTQLVVKVPVTRLEASAYEACRDLLRHPLRPDAILAGADRYALGAARAAAELSLRIPDDLLIAAAVDSHDNVEFRPSITAIDLHPRRQGALAASMLTARLRGQETDAPSIVPGDLIVRNSTHESSGSPRPGYFVEAGNGNRIASKRSERLQTDY